MTPAGTTVVGWAALKSRGQASDPALSNADSTSHSAKLALPLRFSASC